MAPAVKLPTAKQFIKEAASNRATVAARTASPVGAIAGEGENIHAGARTFGKFGKRVTGAARSLGPAIAPLAVLGTSAEIASGLYRPHLETLNEAKNVEWAQTQTQDPTSPAVQQRMAELSWRGVGHQAPSVTAMTASHYPGMIGKPAIPTGMMKVHPAQPNPAAVPGVVSPPSDEVVSPPPPPVPPVDITADGKVVPVNQPNAPDLHRRSYAELLGDVTGGAIPDSIEGFAVANALAGKLGRDDSKRIADNMEVYKTDMAAVPQFAEANRKNRMEPAERAHMKALTRHNEAATAVQTKTAENMLTKEEADEQLIYKEAMQNATLLAKEHIRLAGGDENDPGLIAQIQSAYMSEIMQGYRNDKAGKKTSIVPGQEEKKGTLWNFYQDAQKKTAPAVVTK